MRNHVTLYLIALALMGCAAHDRVVLLPSPQGHDGSVRIKSTQGDATLDQPYMAADVYASGRIETKPMAPNDVNQQFKNALEAQPPRPVSFMLHFLEGKDELTTESKPLLESLKNELARRPSPEIVVIGHTDRVGTIEYNDQLSLKRAEAVRQILIQVGVESSRIEVVGRGSRDPLVPAGDQVPEPRNRRVEISVR